MNQLTLVLALMVYCNSVFFASTTLDEHFDACKETLNKDCNDESLKWLRQKADSEYHELFSLRNRLSLESMANRESLLTGFRVIGLDLWCKYPNDRRKYKWFEMTMADGENAIHYWENLDSAISDYGRKASYLSTYSAKIDWNSLNRWEELYPMLKNEYLEHLKKLSSSTGYQQLIFFLSSELKCYFKLSKNKEYWRSDTFDLEQLCALISSEVRLALNDDSQTSYNEERKQLLYRYISDLDINLLYGYKYYGINEIDIMRILSKLKEINNEVITEWCDQKQNLFYLADNPFDLDVVTINYDTISLRELRGRKVILLDFWSPGCVSCLNRMPYINKLYGKYKAKGFEVLSLCAEDSTAIKYIRKIKSNIDVYWPLVLMGKYADKNSLTRNIWETFGFRSVPQLILLNKEGRMIAYNNELYEGDFENLLRTALK